MAKKNQQTSRPVNDTPRPQQDDLGRTGEERERNPRDPRTGMDEDDEVE